MQSSPETTQKPARLGALFFTVFLDLLGFGLVIPFLAKEARDEFGANEFVGTLLGGTVYSLMQFLFVPVWGRLSDRMGRRPILLWSIAATAVSMASLGLGIVYATSIVWLFAARMFGGIATANLGTASAYIADVTRPEERARGMGLIGAAFGLGFVLGPAIGGGLAKIPIHGREGAVPCFAAAGLSILNFLWALVALRESLPRDRRSIRPPSLSPLNMDALRITLSQPGIPRAILVNTLVIFWFSNLNFTFTYYCWDMFRVDERGTGFILAFIGLCAALVQGGLIRPLSRRLSDASLLRLGIGCQSAAFLGLVLAPSYGKVLLYFAGALLAIGNGLSQPGMTSFISKRAVVDDQGGTLGTSQSFSSLARAFGPALAGYLYAAFGPRSPYLAAAAGMLVALIVAGGLRAPERIQSTRTQTS